MEKINIVIGSDHAGFELKQFVIESLNKTYNFEDLGTNSEDTCDFPDFANSVCNFILKNDNYKGILICGTGVGMSIAANKIKGIRASNVTDVETAVQSVEHNNANVLCLGTTNVSKDLSIDIIHKFLSSSFLEEEKYIHRIGKISNLEDTS